MPTPKPAVVVEPTQPAAVSPKDVAPAKAPVAVAVVAMFLTVRLSNARVASDAKELARVMDHAATTGDYNLKVSTSGSLVLQPVAAAFNSLMQRLNRNGP